MPASKHPCRVWWRAGLACPFRAARGHEEDEPDEKRDALGDAARDSGGIPEELPDFIEMMFPGRKQRTGRITTGDARGVPFPEPIDLPKIKKQQERIAAIQGIGGLKFLPKMDSLSSNPQGRTFLALLASIMVFEGLRRSSGASISPTSAGTRIMEQRLAGLLKQAPVPSASGRGGFHVNAASRMRELLGLGGRRQVRKRRDWSVTSTSPSGFQYGQLPYI